MKGWRFYEEFTDTEDSIRLPQGNVVAIDISLTYGDHIEGLGAVFYSANSPVNWTGIDAGYLREKCKRVSEKRAREIHPELFRRLDDD